MDVDTFVDLLNYRKNGGQAQTPGNPGNGSSTRINRLAVIDPAYIPGNGAPYVTFEGESQLSGKQYAVAGTYSPQPGDRVLLVPIGTTYMIIDEIMNNNQNTVPTTSGPRSFETPWVEVGTPGAPAFSGAWSNYDTFGAAFHNVRFKIDAKGKLRMQGLMYNVTTATTGTLFTLPKGFWPDQRKRFNCGSGANGGHAEITVDTNGVVSILGYLYGGGANYLDLAKIRFFPASSGINWTNLVTGQLSNSWATPVNSDGQLRYYVDPDGIVHWEGSVGGGTVGSVFYNGSPFVSAGLGADDNLGKIFAQPCANGACRLEVGGASGGAFNGIGVQFLQAGGSASNTYVSLDGVEYAGTNNKLRFRYAVGGIGSNLVNSWANYANGYTPVRYYKCSAGIIYFSGLVASGTAGNPVTAPIPIGFRPRADTIFPIIANNVESRIDINPTGTIIVGYGTGGTNGFVSLEDVRYPADW